MKYKALHIFINIKTKINENDTCVHFIGINDWVDRM